ncbi:MAG: hypothetical protein QM691_09500 [Opitutaceae bacterium]
MKTTLLVLLSLLVGLPAFGFVLETKESRRADAAWERTIRRRYDLESLRAFLLSEIAKHPRFDDVDLGGTVVGEKWKICALYRMVCSKEWFFTADESGRVFRLRYTPPNDERDVVFLCERLSRKSFRLVEVRREMTRVVLSQQETLVVPPA